MSDHRFIPYSELHKHQEWKRKHASLNFLITGQLSIKDMEDQKYFVPDISELRIGYELEECRTPHGTPYVKTNWETKILEEDDFQADHEGSSTISLILYFLNEEKPFDGYKRIRVPYLTREQIESEGWVHEGQIRGGGTLFNKEDYQLIFSERSDYCISIEGKPKIGYRAWTGMSIHLFYGQCRDINTLRYIQKLLNIK